MNVIKRDGRKVTFDKNKIQKAIEKAYLECGIKNSVYPEIIADKIEENYNKEKTVEEIQDEVEDYLMSANHTVAKAYILYREERRKSRFKREKLIEKVVNKTQAKDVQNSNANVDENSFSGRKKEASDEIQKEIALSYVLNPKVAEAHKLGYIYEHDLSEANIGASNCLFIDLEHIFTNGFKTRNGDVRPPASFATACQLVAVAFQCQSQVMFGGVASAHLDFDLAPFVKMSFSKYFKDGLKYIENVCQDYIDSVPKDISIEDGEAKSHKKAYQYAIDMLEREGLQAAQGLYHNLNTLESRQGSQVPFSSVNLGRDTSPEGRKVTEWILKASLDGIGKNHNTSIFPISIFQYKKGANANKNDPNYDLKKLAIKSLSKRIYPNWINGDWSQAHEVENDKDTFLASMGCRTLISYDRNGLGYCRVGRGNNVPITIILPKLGIEFGICMGERKEPDLEGFIDAFEDILKLTEKALLERYEIMCAQSVKSAPFMYENHTIKGNGQTTKDSLQHGSLAIGYIGLAEMLTALFGENHVHSDKAYQFGLNLVKRINEFAKEASERNGLNFGCYASPAENLAYTAMKNLQSQYGKIKGVTDKEYLTNSHHVPVWEKVSIYDKLKLEAPFTKYPTAGCITYIELDAAIMENYKAIEDIIDYAFNELDIPYLAFNFPIDTCCKCGYQGAFNDECPKCQSKEFISLRRVTGYLTSDYRNFNKGKQEEVKDRVKHNAYTNFKKN